MDPFSLFVVFAAGTVIVTAISAYFNHQQKVKRNLKGEQRVAIRAFNHNEVGKIVGQATIHEDYLVSPLSGRKCVFYQIQVQQRVDDNWKTILNDQQCVNFLVKEGIGTALVDISSIKGHIVKDLKLNMGTWKSPTPRMARYLKQRNIKTTSFFGSNRTMRLYEGVIHIGETIAVKGKGEWEMKPDPEEQMLIMKGHPNIELFVSDDASTF